MLTLVTVLVYVVSFGITLLCLRQFAVWLAAGESSYTSCFIALLLAYIVGFGVLKGVEATGAHPALMFVSVPIALVIYAVFLKTGIFKALAIVVLSGLVSTVLFVALILGVGMMGMGVAGAMLGAGMIAMEDDWQNQIAVNGETSGNGMIVTHRATVRADGSGSISFSSHGAPVTSSDTLPEPSTRAAPAPPPRKPKPVYAYRLTEIDGLRSLENATVKVRTRDGREHKGELVKVGKEAITLRKRISGGKFDFEVRIKGITEVRVWAEVST